MLDVRVATYLESHGSGVIAEDDDVEEGELDNILRNFWLDLP